MKRMVKCIRGCWKPVAITAHFIKTPKIVGMHLFALIVGIAPDISSELKRRRVRMRRIYTEKDVMVSYNTYGTVLSIGDRFRIYNGYEFGDAMVAFLSWLNNERE